METTKSVGIWVRVSTDMQGDSAEHHEQRATGYAQSRGWNIAATYVLKAVSGKLVMEHPETKRMLKDIKSGHITGLIFSKLARLARSTKQLLEFAEIFKESGADLISLQESIDTSTPAGRLFYTVIAAMAQWEREEIADRVAASVPVRAKLGKPLGGAAPYGYRWDKEGKKLEINETEAPIRILMYEIFLKLRRIQTTAKELNKLGHRTRNGSTFSDNTVLRLIRDPIAKGLRRANYTKSRGQKKHWDFKPSTEWVFHECPGLISEQTWNECNQFLDSQYKKREKAGRKSTYLLGGMVTCTCGTKMHVYHTAPVYSCKKCRNKIQVADLDEIYYGELSTFLCSSDETAKYQAEAETLLTEKESLLDANKTELGSLTEQMQELVTMRTRRELSPDDFTRYYAPLKERADALGNTVAELESLVDVLRIQHLSSDEVIRKSRDLYTQWPELPFDEKRAIVELITESIIVGTEDITITYSHLPAPLHPTNPGTNRHNRMDS